MNYKLLLISFLLLFINSSQSPLDRNIDPQFLSGNINLNLRHGVWKIWQEKPVYQDINLDLVCENSECQSEIWGYAPKHNTADHQGKLEFNQLTNSWELKITTNVRVTPWSNEVNQAKYYLQIIPKGEGLIGYYTGSLNGRKLSGEVTGKISPFWPIKVKEHQAITPREHPRLIVRKSDLSLLQKRAKTNYGQGIIKQLEKSLQEEIYYDGYVPTGGYHATGHCFLAWLNNDAQAAAKAWEIVQKSMENRGDRLLEQSPIVAGIALAYDLCYNNWTEEQQQQMTNWLAMEVVKLANGDSAQRGWNDAAWSNWNARARGAGALAALAILAEPEEFFPNNKFYSEPNELWRYFMTSERNVKRYLTTAIGDRGLGSEGDLYTTEPLSLTIIPFLQAYRHVLGEDLITNSKPEWFLPHYMTRLIYDQKEFRFPAYGRHRSAAYARYLFPLGLNLIPEELLPGIFWFYNNTLGLEGDRTFGINKYLPHLAIFALKDYPEQTSMKNPAEVLEKVLEDKQKGFYVFRNHWQDNEDFIASIYGKKEFLSASWSFPETNSFRIWGLGGKWADAGPYDGKLESENIVVADRQGRQTGKTVFFENQDNGSGVVSILSHNWLRSFAVDYSNSSGASGLFVVVDRFKPDQKEKQWIMHTAEKVTLNDQSFLLTAKNGATMKGTFITPVKLSTETTERGQKIVASGENEFFIVMTVQKNSPPSMSVSGNGLNALVTIGQQTISVSNQRIILIDISKN
jgi:hypothetical protein